MENINNRNNEIKNICKIAAEEIEKKLLDLLSENEEKKIVNNVEKNRNEEEDYILWLA